MSKEIFLVAFQINNNKLYYCWHYYLLYLVFSEGTNSLSRCSQTHSLIWYSRINLGIHLKYTHLEFPESTSSSFLTAGYLQPSGIGAPFLLSAALSATLARVPESSLQRFNTLGFATHLNGWVLRFTSLLSLWSFNFLYLKFCLTHSSLEMLFFDGEWGESGLSILLSDNC